MNELRKKYSTHSDTRHPLEAINYFCIDLPLIDGSFTFKSYTLYIPKNGKMESSIDVCYIKFYNDILTIYTKPKILLGKNITSTRICEGNGALEIKGNDRAGEFTVIIRKQI